MSTSTYPVRVDASLQNDLSRWRWLVKWLLVLPHYLVLAFLWLAYLVLSVVAFVATRLSGPPGDLPSGAAFPWAGPGEVVALGHPALSGSRAAGRQRVVGVFRPY
jgi:hypothetical protein